MLRSLFRPLRRSRRYFPRSRCGRAAVRPSRRRPRGRAAGCAAKPSPHSPPRGSTPCAASERTTRSSRTSIWPSISASGTGKSCCFTSCSRIFSRACDALLVFLGRVEILANFLAQLVERRDFRPFRRRFLREFVVQFGQLLFLDALHLHGVVVGLSRELLIGIIVRILRFEMSSSRRRFAPRRFSVKLARVSSAPKWHRMLSAWTGSPPPVGRPSILIRT